MIKELNETNVKVKKARLLTIAEFEKYEKDLEGPTTSVCWWLADTNESGDAAYVEGDYREEDMFTSTTYENTYVRVALDITGGVKGEKFIYCGYVFTALSKTLAISDNVTGPAKYYDEELLGYIYEDDVTCTISAVIETIFG